MIFGSGSTSGIAGGAKTAHSALRFEGADFSSSAVKRPDGVDFCGCKEKSRIKWLASGWCYGLVLDTRALIDASLIYLI